MISLNEMSKLWTDMGIFGCRRVDRRREWLKKHREIDRVSVKKERECFDWMKRHEKKLRDSVENLIVDLKLDPWQPSSGPLIATIEALVTKNEELITLKNERFAKWDELMIEYRSFSRQNGSEASYILPSSTVPSEKDIENLEKKLTELRPNFSTKDHGSAKAESGKDAITLPNKTDKEDDNFQECQKVKELEEDLRICLDRLRRKEAELAAAKKIIALSRLL